MVPGVLVDIAVARLQVTMALGAARAFEAVLHLAVTDLGVGLVIAVALLRAVMDLGVGQVIVAERLRVAMVLGTRRGLMGQRPTGGVDHYYGGTYYGVYHPPTVVNTYSTGCSNCGGWYAAGAAATGAVIGATAANANNANTYAEGYAAGAKNTAYAMGAIYPTLPPGATIQTIGNTIYYLYNGVWFSPSYGANGVYYRALVST
jgi:hypothetical protein